jgi:hypothetical protein
MATRPKRTPSSDRTREPNSARLARIRRARDENVPVSETRPVHMPRDEIVRRANLLQTGDRWPALERMRMLGELVFRTVFEDDENQWRILGGLHPEYKALVAHPALEVSSMMLWRALHVRALFRRFPMLHQVRHIGLSHVCAVIGLPESAQDELLMLAETEQWSSRRMDRAVRARRPQSTR